MDTTLEFELAGLSCVLDQDGLFGLSPVNVITLPSSLVCGLAAASYEFPEQKQAILDALTPFQIVSKVWSSQCVQQMMRIQDIYEEQRIVFVGSWFGQQSAMLARWAPDYHSWSVQLVDKDQEACRVARRLITRDNYHRRVGAVVTQRDIFELEFEPGTLFVWNGLEHFESPAVETFLEKHTECAFVFQSTSMPAKDHTNLANDVEDILKSVPAEWDTGIVYKGEISTELGSRYMMAICGPGMDIAGLEESDDNDMYLDGPNAPPSSH